MTDKELKRLKRAELLQLLLTQSREIDRLRAELEDVQNKLNDKTIVLQSSGSIAEASLRVHNIFEDAQRAADQYLENVRRKSEELISAMTPENAAALVNGFTGNPGMDVNTDPGSSAASQAEEGGR